MLIYNLFFPYIKEHFSPHTKASHLRPALLWRFRRWNYFINSHPEKMHQTGVSGHTGGSFVFLVRHRAKIQL